ncbi:indolepyruvate oxidoreductase subunit beta family protein [Thalassovita aquimarina]|uniref:indolepyruvate oxidoreductase subunit beta family protein n=1 Tax=Thalassovita aquimarina TaxID=2785917 RepID=UPI003562CAAE
MTDKAPFRILLAALGGEGGGVLMNWIVEAARASGHRVQATSVPGVAQRTGSTSYYIEIARKEAPDAVLSLVPMPGRVDAVVCSELVEAARVMAAGFVSPRLTTLISSTARFYSTAEKIAMGDGRYDEANVRKAAEKMARDSYLLDLGQLATENGTFVSATMYGALCGSGVLPFDLEQARTVLGDARSQAGFDAAVAAVQRMKDGAAPEAPEAAESDPAPRPDLSDLPDGLRTVIGHGLDRLRDYQDDAYAETYRARANLLIASADLSDHRAVHALTEACRRLALWMAYEDVARVADLKTRPERFERIRDEVQLQPGQTLTVTEYLKPRAEEIADILPVPIGRRIMARVARGGGIPFTGRGIHVRSNGVIGYRMLRTMAAMKHLRRRSYRFAEEQRAIEDWLMSMQAALAHSPDFAMGLAELPRVLKGYSDTLQRGKTAYARIMQDIVRPAVAAGTEADTARWLRDAIGAALADDSHAKLEAVLAGQPPAPEIPNLKRVENV